MSKNIDLQYKILVLGESSVGKTSLLMRYAEDKFESTVQTIGVDFKNKYIIYNNKRIQLELWDTAGQERFKGIAKNYFHAANGVILVFDITNKDSFNKLKYWIDEGKTNVGQDTEIIIAENKVDLENERKVTKDTINEFGKKMGLEILETSAKTGLGVDEIFKRLVSRLYSNKKIGKVKDDNSTKIAGGKDQKKDKCGC
jgi:small GTP-binding protein